MKNEYLTTLDTIAFSYRFNNIKDILVDSNNIEKYFTSFNSNNNNSFSSLELKKEYRDMNCFGIDRVCISSYIYNGNSYYRLKLIISSKILEERYFESINKNNIKLVLEKVIDSLKGILKLKLEDFEKFTVNSVHYTKNIVNDTKYSNVEILNAIDFYVENSQKVKSKNIDYLSKGTFYIKNSKKQQTRIYDKSKELKNVKKKENKKFIQQFPSTLKNFENVLRIEHTINEKKNISKEFNIKQYELCNIYNVLNYNQTNISYERMSQYINNRHNLDKEEKNFEDFTIDDYNKYIMGESYYNKFGNNADKIKNFLKSLKNNGETERAIYQKNQRELKKILEAIRFYLSTNNLKEINYKDVINTFLEKLKNS